MTVSDALITGIGGQDGRLLAQQLSARGWRLWGVVLPDSPESRLDSLIELPGLTLIEADLADVDACRRIVAELAPNVVFHLAALSSVAGSWENPVETAQVNGLASVALMAACRELSNTGHDIRFINASSAEIFAATREVPQNESTPLAPNSPYGAAKAFAHVMADTFRSGGLWVSNAILYNHESPLRPKTFVTRKITSAVAAVALDRGGVLNLGNLDARRDWGWAPDYIDCLTRIALHDRPDNFVVATGRSHSVRDFVTAAFAAVGIEDWSGYVQADSKFVRPTDAIELVGDASKARAELDWRPTVMFADIVRAMVSADLQDPDGVDSRQASIAREGAG